ncbi:MAG TPA: hypothetical protein VHU87_00705 [Rhizomicrobium sp.]|jgi:hypothetical protein|nr:hypothetical protein [Rhizomicrobium sp.]
MPSRKVKRVYPMQMALMILLGHARTAPAQSRKAVLKRAISIHQLTQPPSRF